MNASSHSPSISESEEGSGGERSMSARNTLFITSMRSLYASDDVGLYDCPRSRAAANESSWSLSSVFTPELASTAGGSATVSAIAMRDVRTLDADTLGASAAARSQRSTGTASLKSLCIFIPVDSIFGVATEVNQHNYFPNQS